MSKIVEYNNASIHNQVQNGLIQYRRLSSDGKISVTPVSITQISNIRLLSILHVEIQMILIAK